MWSMVRLTEKNLGAYIKHLQDTIPDNIEKLPNYESNKHKGGKEKDLTRLLNQVMEESQKILTPNNATKFELLQKTNLFYEFLEELSADTTTTHIGKALEHIYKKRIVEGNIAQPITLQVLDSEEVIHTEQINMQTNDQYYMELKRQIGVSLWENYEIAVIEDDENHVEFTKKMEQNREEMYLYNTISNILGENRTNFQGLADMLFGEKEIKNNIDLQKAQKWLNKHLQNIPTPKHKAIQEKLYLTMFERYIARNMPNNTNLFFDTDIENIFKTGKVYISLYSGPNNYDDTEPSNFIYNLSTLVQFIDLLKKFEKVRSTELFIKMSGNRPQKMDIIKRYT